MPSRRLGAAPPVSGEPAPPRRGRTTQEMLAERRGTGPLGTLLRVGLALVAVVVLLGILYLGASALEGDEPVEHAPWADRSAPDVRPAPLEGQ